MFAACCLLEVFATLWLFAHVSSPEVYQLSKRDMRIPTKYTGTCNGCAHNESSSLYQRKIDFDFLYSYTLGRLISAVIKHVVGQSIKWISQLPKSFGFAGNKIHELYDAHNQFHIGNSFNLLIVTFRIDSLIYTRFFQSVIQVVV